MATTSDPTTSIPRPDGRDPVRRPRYLRSSAAERAFHVLNILFFLGFGFITLYPFLNALAYSLTPAMETYGGHITVFPRGFTLDNYRLLFARHDIFRAALISVARTVLGIVLHVTVVSLAAYAVSAKGLPFKKTIILFLLVPLYLDAGMIPHFVLIYDLGLMNRFLVYVIPQMFAVFWMIIMRTYFETVPDSLSESARMDGASELQNFLRIIIPLSAPMLATVALFQGVWQWNMWMDAMLYVNRPRLHPLMMLLRRVLMENELNDASSVMAATQSQASTHSPESIRMATLIVTTGPIILIYPFFQRYFVKGMTVGAVKE